MVELTDALLVDLFSSSLFSLFYLSFSFAFYPFFYPVLHVRIKALRQSHLFYIFQIYTFQNISQFTE